LQVPVLQAIVMADNVYTDERTRKKIIAGTFDTMWASTFPGAFGRKVQAYIAIRNVRGEVPLTLRYVDLQSNEALFEMEGTIESDDPLKPFELIVEIPGLPMPHVGVYALEVLSNDVSIGSLRLLAKQRENLEESDNVDL
jgi:hypothetical protein